MKPTLASSRPRKKDSRRIKVSLPPSSTPKADTVQVAVQMMKQLAHKQKQNCPTIASVTLNRSMTKEITKKLPYRTADNSEGLPWSSIPSGKAAVAMYRNEAEEITKKPTLRTADKAEVLLWPAIPSGKAVDDRPKKDEGMGNDNDNDPDIRSRKFPRWKVLFITGLLLIGISVMAFIGHARQQQQNERSAPSSSSTPNEIIIENDDTDLSGASENEQSPCGPRAWPELVGVRVSEARRQILRENRCVVVQIVVIGNSESQEDASSPVYDPERVRLYTNPDTGTVVQTPRVG